LYKRRRERNKKKKAIGTKKGWEEWGRKTGIKTSDNCPVIALLMRSGSAIGKSIVKVLGGRGSVKIRN